MCCGNSHKGGVSSTHGVVARKLVGAVEESITQCDEVQVRCGAERVSDKASEAAFD